MHLAEATIDIDADPDRVFDLFTTAQGLKAWMAAEAAVDLRPGGSWRWVHDDGATCSGHYVTIDRPRRLVFTYGWERGGFPEVAPGSTEVEVTFEPTADGTRVSVEHRGLSIELAERHAAGWSYFIDLLRLAATGGDLPGVRHPTADSEGDR